MLMPEQRAVLQEYFANFETWTVAMVADGSPWLAASYFAPIFEDGKLTFIAAYRQGTLKLAVITANPCAAFLIQRGVPDRWVQGRALAEVIQDPEERQHALDHLLATAPGVAPFLKGQVAAVRFRPTWLRYRDRRPGGASFEVEWSIDDHDARLD